MDRRIAVGRADTSTSKSRGDIVSNPIKVRSDVIIGDCKEFLIYSPYSAEFYWQDCYKDKENPKDPFSELDVDTEDHLRNSGNLDEFEIKPFPVVEFEYGISYGSHQKAYLVGDEAVEFAKALQIYREENS